MKKSALLTITVFTAALAFAFLYFQKGTSQPEVAIEAPSKAPLAVVSSDIQKEGVEKQDPKSDTLVDHKAIAFHISGDSKIQKKGEGEWLPLKQGDFIEEKDKIQTGKDALVEVAYDDFYLNLAQITSETLAEFYSIEPTQIYLRYGEIYNTLDGLPKDMKYSVGTNLAVAAIRGTRFARKFDKANFVDTTLVSQGIVQVKVGEPGAGESLPAKNFDVAPNQALSFNAEQIKAEAIDKLEVKELSLEEMDQMNSVFGQSEKHLAEFAGGSDDVYLTRDKWQTLLKDQKEVASLKAKTEIANFSKRFDSSEAWRKGAETPIAAAKEEKVEKKMDELEISAQKIKAVVAASVSQAAAAAAVRKDAATPPPAATTNTVTKKVSMESSSDN